MKDEEKKDPIEELKKQLQEALSHSNLNFTSTNKPEIVEAETDSEEPQLEQSHSDSETLKRIREFNLKPKEIKDYLDRFVVKQEDAKKVLSVAICDHYNHIRRCIEDPNNTKLEYTKQNILLLGPTGVGKTYLMRNIAKLIGVPFVKADATKFSETGYVGGDVEDLVRDLVKSAGGNTDVAQYGIIYIDEIDKIATAGEGGKDVSGRGVQINLLKLMEESDVNLFTPTDMLAQMQAMMDLSHGKKKKKRMNTRHILFIVSGAFDKLAENVRDRVERASIGFGSDPTSTEDQLDKYLQQTSTRDFIKYGFEPEFIGRLPVRVACESLNREDLARILTSSEGSILRQYTDDFKGYGIDFNLTDEAIEEIAGQASKEKTGARGLLTVLERVFRDYKYELPSTAIQSFEVSTDTIDNPKDSLKQLLLDNQHLQEKVLREDLERYSRSFEQAHGLVLKFSDEAVEALMECSVKEDKMIRTICESRFEDYQHGLSIVSRNTGRYEFELTAEAIDNPDGVLSRWVVESFKEKEAAKEPSEVDESQAS